MYVFCNRWKTKNLLIKSDKFGMSFSIRRLSIVLVYSFETYDSLNENSSWYDMVIM